MSDTKSTSCPKLGVYTSVDGSSYSKPEEVRDVLEWIKARSSGKDKSK